MSQGTRQEVLIRSLIEGLCRTLRKHYENQPRQRIKVLAIEAIMAEVIDLWRDFPIELSHRESLRVQKFLIDYDETHKDDPAWQSPETLISLIMALGDHLQKKSSVKKLPVARINQCVQMLYDTFDRQGAKVELMLKGGQMADDIIRREI